MSTAANTFDAQWNAAVRAIQQSAQDCASGKTLSRVTRTLSRHELRRSMRPKHMPHHGSDILDSLHHWRKVRSSNAHAATQYIAHVRDAMARSLVKLVDAERRAKADAQARALIAANPTQPFDLVAYAHKLFGIAA